MWTSQIKIFSFLGLVDYHKALTKSLGNVGSATISLRAVLTRYFFWIGVLTHNLVTVLVLKSVMTVLTH